MTTYRLGNRKSARGSADAGPNRISVPLFPQNLLTSNFRLFASEDYIPILRRTRFHREPTLKFLEQRGPYPRFIRRTCNRVLSECNHLRARFNLFAVDRAHSRCRAEEKSWSRHVCAPVRMPMSSRCLALPAIAFMANRTENLARLHALRECVYR